MLHCVASARCANPFPVGADLFLSCVFNKKKNKIISVHRKLVLYGGREEKRERGIYALAWIGFFPGFSSQSSE